MRGRAAHRKKEKEARNARDLVGQLFAQAEKMFGSAPAKSNALVKKARTYAMKFRIRIGPPWNRRYCRNCSAFLVPGGNARFRTRSGKLVILCRECNHITRVTLGRTQ